MTDNWQGKRVLIMGAARQGQSLARYLIRHGAKITLNDIRPENEMRNARENLSGIDAEWVLGAHPTELLDKTDLVCVSGGIPLDLPLLIEAKRRGILLTNDSQIFLEAVPCPVIGITGSAGKTTTTTLVGRMAEAGVSSPSNVWVGGNIGKPLLDDVDAMKTGDLVVMELSSFQLELMTVSPHIGAVLNITPNHLDRHGSMHAYTAAKARLVDFQAPEDITVLGRDDPGAWALESQVKGKLLAFSLHPLPAGQDGTYLKDDILWLQDAANRVAVMARQAILLRGVHNIQNVLAACAIAHSADLPIDCLRAGVEGFSGVPHRLQFVRTRHGTDWYNDSIATTPERAMAAIHSFEEPLVMLVGGRDKHLPWNDFADLVHQRVDHLVIFGEAAGLIQSAIGPSRSGQRPYTIDIVDGLKQAVETAAGQAEPGDIVLLAPGGTSFDEFIDFEERGERYIQWVKELS